MLGLVVGKPIGLLGASWLAVHMGLADLPQGVTWRQMAGVGVLAGIGFTMSLFIAALAFTQPEVLATAKLGILIASLIAGGQHGRIADWPRACLATRTPSSDD